jgi:hypothetical protein
MPPTIPTSFVPKQPVHTGNAKKRSSAFDPFNALAYLVFGIALLASASVFGYQFYLQSVVKAKESQIASAQEKIDQGTVEQFIRLRNRFTAAKDILNKHVVLSQFFSVLENLTVQGVQWNTLTIDVPDSRKAVVEMKGSARSFNALAAQSSALATDTRIKHAIFSSIATNNGLVTFVLKAELDPAMVVGSGALGTVPQPQPQVNPTTPAKTSTTTP